MVGWKDLVFTVERPDHPDIKEFLDAVAHIFANGGAVLRCFRPSHGPALEFSLWNHSQGMDNALQAFLTCPSVVAAIPELRIEVPLQQPPEFHLRSSFGMEGDLTGLLLRGGAYRRFEGTVEQARSLSRRFMEALFGPDLHKAMWVASSSTPWTEWFEDVAWDSTFVAMDEREKRVVLLCITDTD